MQVAAVEAEHNLARHRLKHSALGTDVPRSAQSPLIQGGSRGRAAPDSARMPIALAVRRFETPAYLRQGRIVYRETPEAVDFYEYHCWAAETGPTVTTALIDSIRSARLFSFVKPYDGEDKPDYLLTGRLERLDEVDY